MADPLHLIFCPWHRLLPDPESFVVAAAEFVPAAADGGREAYADLTFVRGAEIRRLRFLGARWKDGAPESATTLGSVGVADASVLGRPDEAVGAADLDGELGSFLVAREVVLLDDGPGHLDRQPNVRLS